MIFLIISALTIGFLGSFHCIGMCGPIAMALPISQTNSFGRTGSLFLYHFGRSTTYSLLGLVAGGFGQSLFFLNAQRFFSIFLGLVILIVLGLTYLNGKAVFGSGIFSGLNKIKNKISTLLSKQGYINIFTIGLLNGLLPCGLVYMAMAGAAASANVFQGAMFMWFFGMATIPVMLTISLLGGTVGFKFRQTIKKATPIIWSLMAVLLILRGLNLGIPYVSPKITSSEITATPGSINCHK
ncbi:MAG: sulfite exporter TauE/SafE family protein [Bacteroidia bacterium]|nr:sulfite exporter TauE/SafE family protein [Bacteroidia bacterium]